MVNSILVYKILNDYTAPNTVFLNHERMFKKGSISSSQVSKAILYNPYIRRNIV